MVIIASVLPPLTKQRPIKNLYSTFIFQQINEWKGLMNVGLNIVISGDWLYLEFSSQ
jgi:hypothetical protein